MKKMKLEIDSLRVESFSADAAARGARGTVRGNDLSGTVIVADPSDRSFIDTCWINTCAGCGTEYMC